MYKTSFERDQIHILRQRINELPRFMIVVDGPRQIGKSTMVRQVLDKFPASTTFVATDMAADRPSGQTTNLLGSQEASISAPTATPTGEWIIQHWNQARIKARALDPGKYYILAIDEIQKIPRWSEIVKGLWDEDRSKQLPLHIILLGSSPWLMQKGLAESLAGRFESIRLGHWSYDEMQEAFDYSLEEFIYFGGYPGSADLIGDENRWRSYVKNSLIKRIFDLDILQMTRIDKPALLRNLFELGCSHYSGQIIALTKIVGQLQDAGNTTTLTHYLNLLSQAGLLTGIGKYYAGAYRRRASPPKLNVHNTALISALGGYSFAEAKNDRTYWGHLVESAVGTHLINNKPEEYEIFYWREEPYEVDFVITKGKKILAIEVKSAEGFAKPKGLEVFTKKFDNFNVIPLIIGDGGIALQEFLSYPIENWLE